ncbi:hypothetical protein CBL_12485 [Carabus blaptoides fortunei]
MSNIENSSNIGESIYVCLVLNRASSVSSVVRSHLVLLLILIMFVVLFCEQLLFCDWLVAADALRPVQSLSLSRRVPPPLGRRGSIARMQWAAPSYVTPPPPAPTPPPRAR